MFKPCARQAPKTDARAILVSVPRWDRVPPQILRLVTSGRRLRSAVLVSDGTSGSATKTESSPYPVRGRFLMCFAMRRHSLVWATGAPSRRPRACVSALSGQVISEALQAKPGVPRRRSV